MGIFEDIEWFTGFEWDEHNTDKNWVKHKVISTEAEQVFLNRPIMLADDEKHSKQEPRYHALGHTDGGRLLFVAFTKRNELIRVISARDMSREEREVYRNHEKDSKIQE